MKKFIALLMALSMMLLCACGNTPAESKPTAAPTAIPTEATTLPPETTEAPTEEPTEPAVALHSGLREDGSFDEGTLFIGDSMTYGLVYSYLMANDLIGDARYMAIVGAPIQYFFYSSVLNRDKYCIYSPEFEGMSYDQAVASVGEEITAIYFMMGTNYSSDTNAQTYIEIVDYMMEHCPNATIYLQLIPYASSCAVQGDAVYWSIMEAYGHYAMEGIENVKLLDIKRAVGVHLTDDGVHLTYEGQENWYKALVANAEDNNIPQ